MALPRIQLIFLLSPAGLLLLRVLAVSQPRLLLVLPLPKPPPDDLLDASRLRLLLLLSLPRVLLRLLDASQPQLFLLSWPPAHPQLQTLAHLSPVARLLRQVDRPTPPALLFLSLLTIMFRSPAHLRFPCTLLHRLLRVVPMSRVQA